MTLSANCNSCPKFTNAFDRVFIFMRFEKLIRILGIARDAGKLSANHVALEIAVRWKIQFPVQTTKHPQTLVRWRCERGTVHS